MTQVPARNLLLAVIAIIAIVQTTGCASQQARPAPLPQYQSNWTWSMLESSLDQADFARAYARFNREATDPNLAAESYAGISVIALFAPKVMAISARQNKNQALIFSEKAILADPTSPKAQYARGLALSANAQYQQADVFLAAIAPRTRKSCDYALLAADIAIRKDGPAAALPKINNALDCTPGKHAQYILNLAAAKAMENKGNYAKAQAYYDEAISINPHAQDIYLHYATMLLAADDLDRAIAAAHKAADMQNSPQALSLISLIHTKTAEKHMAAAHYASAERQYRLAIAYDTANTDAYRALVSLYANNLNMCNEAMQYADFILQRNPADQQAKQAKAKCGD